jgi:regulator of protease activity HflC (stomatin/prohibitin superfamily)
MSNVTTEVFFPIFLLSFILLIIVMASSIVVIVPQGYAYTLERFGRYIRTLSPGLHFITPFLERIGSRINMMESVLSIPSQEIISKDNAMVRVDGICYFKVIEPAYAAYRVYSLDQAIVSLTITNIRTVLGSLDLDQMLSQRDLINERLLSIVDDATKDWGAKITRIEIKDIQPPADLVASMGSQMKAEREKRARILEAEGIKQAAILTAEGKKESVILEAQARRDAAFLQAEARERQSEAEAQANKCLSEAIAHGDKASLNYYIAQQYVEAFKQLAHANNAKTIFMPFESTALLSSLSGIKELLQSDK